MNGKNLEASQCLTLTPEERDWILKGAKFEAKP